MFSWFFFPSRSQNHLAAVLPDPAGARLDNQTFPNPGESKETPVHGLFYQIISFYFQERAAYKPEVPFLFI